jgi:hypothetical protein
MKKFLITLMLLIFLFDVPVFSEGREALAGDETQLPPTLVQTGSQALLQTITVGVGRRRRSWRRRTWWRRNRRWHSRRRARWHNRRRWRLPRRGRIRVRTRYAHSY